MDDELRAYIERRVRVLDRLAAIIVDELGAAPRADCIDPNAPLFGTGLEIDSVAGVELVLASEAAFDVRFPEDARTAMRTLNGITDLVLALQDERDAS